MLNKLKIPDNPNSFKILKLLLKPEFIKSNNNNMYNWHKSNSNILK